MVDKIKVIEKRGYYWMRLYTRLIGNAKFMKLPKAVRFDYLALYMLARDCDAYGFLGVNKEPLTIEDLSFLLYDDEDELSKSIALLLVKEFLVIENGFYVINRFKEEQDEETNEEKTFRLKDRNAFYQRTHRAKENESTSTEKNITEENKKQEIIKEQNKLKEEEKIIEEEYNIIEENRSDPIVRENLTLRSDNLTETSLSFDITKLNPEQQKTFINYEEVRKIKELEDTDEQMEYDGLLTRMGCETRYAYKERK